MVDSHGTEKGETSRKRHGLVDNGAVGGRAGKKLRPTKVLDRVTRKRVWNEMVETDIGVSKPQTLNRDSSISESQGEVTSDSPVRKVLRTVSLKEDDHIAAEDKEITNLSQNGDDTVSGLGSLELSKGIQSQCKSGVLGGTESSRVRPRRWKPYATTISSVHQRRDDSDGAIRGSAECEGDRNADDPLSLNAGEADVVVEKVDIGKERKVYQHEAVRKSLQTVNLEENGVEDSKQSIREIPQEDAVTGGGRHLLKPAQGITDSRDKKRKGKKTDELPHQHLEKKLRITRIPEPLQEKETSTKKTWKRLVREDSEAGNTSEDVGVMVSDAWKRLREKSTDTSCSSVNGQSESDSSMSSDNAVEELFKRNKKKARCEQHVPLNGKKWKRINRDKREGITSKRIREDSVSESSTSSGSDVAQAYLHNRMWKRPRFENLMSVQARPWRRQNRDVEVSEESTRKRPQTDTAERSQKRARK